MDVNLNESRQIGKAHAERLLERIGKVMFGMDDVIQLCIIALYTNGHVLLEGNPGLGKTELVKALAKELNLDTKRIQFTPDLLPSDIIYTPIFKQQGSQQYASVELGDGPIFTSLLLADEINRATQKTQSALLEAMAERRVTFSGEPKDVCAKDKPFMVLATENPIENEGTYELPEAQLDRFMFKILMPVPNRANLVKILNKTAGSGSEDDQQTKLEFDPKLREKVKNILPLPTLRAHVINLFMATNSRVGEMDIAESEWQKTKKLVLHVKFGLGPRAAIALLLAAQAWTLFFEEPSTSPDAIALAKIIIPTLRHRIKLQYSWYKNQEKNITDIDRDRIIDHFLRDLCMACIPKSATKGYQSAFESTLNEILVNKPY